ncbi:hypothetical protein H9P43_002072 [Blastocladiella emersonii ATCC 22665]|nr:hypothetical protein H9P43_002072 [Blastocladiella emersonii ATCC 22665]
MTNAMRITDRAAFVKSIDDWVSSKDGMFSAHVAVSGSNQHRFSADKSDGNSSCVAATKGMANAASVTTEVEFQARFGAACPVLMPSVYVAEAAACRNPFLSSMASAFDALADEAAAAVAQQQDALEDALAADFSLDSAAFDQALVEDSLDEGLEYLEI